jgi:hypothetical protein
MVNIFKKKVRNDLFEIHLIVLLDHWHESMFTSEKIYILLNEAMNQKSMNLPILMFLNDIYVSIVIEYYSYIFFVPMS